MSDICRWALRTAIALAVLVLPDTASAATYLASSMKPTCLTSDCRQIQFVLDLESNVYVDWVFLNSTDTNRWRFHSLVAATDAEGNALTWEWQLGAPWYQTADGLYLKAGGYLAPEPIHLTVNMDVYSDPSTLESSYHWQGHGSTTSPGSESTAVVFEGGATVTPEPVSMLLLGTGLAGVAGARRRRRRAEELDASIN